jgi:hypothetical protein
VRRGVLIANGTIGRGGKDRAVVDDYRTNGYFVTPHGLAREVERVPDVLLVGGRDWDGHGLQI